MPENPRNGEPDRQHFVAVRGLYKSYAEGESSHTVLAGLTCSIARGQSVALLGSSGSGKSTLLNLLAAIDTPDQGSIVIAGVRLDKLNEAARTRWRRQHLGFVFQFFNLIPTLSVEENICLPMQLNGFSPARQRQRARDLLAHVGLEARAGSFPENLSGGEQQRVAIVRALAHQPVLILADEPTGNLDSVRGAQVLNVMLALAAQNATTLLIATHSRAVADRVDRVWCLEQGGLLEGGGA